MKKEKGIMLGAKGIFYLLFSAVVLWAVLGMTILPSEKNDIKGVSSAFAGEWYQVFADGSREKIDVPGRCDVKKGEVAVAEALIPQTVEDGKYLCFRSSLQDMRIYIDGELRQQYNTENSRVFGKTSVSAYVFVEMYEKDAGKKLRVETQSISNYSGIMNMVYYGDRFSIWSDFATQYGAGLVIALSMLVLAIICIVFSVALRYLHNKSIILEYLSWGILLVAIWVIAENRLRQLFFPNVSLMANVAFFAMMLLPLPFAIYINSIQKMRYSKCYCVIYTLIIADFIICTGLQMLNIMDFSQTMIMMHGVMIISVAVMVVTILIDIKRKHIQSYQLVAYGILGLIAAGIIEIGNVYFKDGQVSGNGLCLGLIFLLTTAIIKTGQDILGLERERQRAISDNEAKECFLAKMSHEIRTPINTMIGMNEMIARESTDPAIAEYVLSAQEAGKTLLALVNDVLDFSRIESGNLHLTENVYQLGALINEEVYMLQARAEKKELEVVVNIDEKLPSYLYGDEVRIKQIAGSLLSNAVKYTEEGCITLTVGSSCSDAGDFFLKITVADTGIGISEKKLERLFEGFSKLEDKNSVTIAGAGLGLPIMKELLDEMQGEIKVRSMVGKGTLFMVTIPQKVIDDTPIGVFTNRRGEEQISLTKYKPSFIAPEVKVLAVDDNEMNLSVVKGFLKHTKIELDTALSGNQCLELCKEKKYHVILMDHMMPEPDGVQTLQILRTEQDGCNQETPVVVLTANAVAGSRESYLEDGFADYLSKPLVPDMLEKVLVQFIPEELLIREEISEDDIKVMESSSPATVATNEDDMQEEGEQKEEIIIKQLGLSYCGGDEEFYMEMLNTYHKQGKEYAEKLPVCYEGKDWKNYSIITHAMKSTSLSIGARNFSEMAKEHEMAGKSENAVWIEENWDTFYENFMNVLNVVEEFLPVETESEKQLSGSEVVSQEDYKKECELLLDYLGNYEMNAAMEQVEKLEGLEIAEMDLSARNEVFEKIKTAIDDFEYGMAEELLVEWMKGG